MQILHLNLSKEERKGLRRHTLHDICPENLTYWKILNENVRQVLNYHALLFLAKRHCPSITGVFQLTQQLVFWNWNWAANSSILWGLFSLVFSFLGNGLVFMFLWAEQSVWNCRKVLDIRQQKMNFTENKKFPMTCVHLLPVPCHRIGLKPSKQPN